jgi:hypothetical protein
MSFEDLPTLFDYRCIKLVRIPDDCPLHLLPVLVLLEYPAVLNVLLIQQLILLLHCVLKPFATCLALLLDFYY